MERRDRVRSGVLAYVWNGLDRLWQDNRPGLAPRLDGLSHRDRALGRRGRRGRAQVPLCHELEFRAAMELRERPILRPRQGARGDSDGLHRRGRRQRLPAGRLRRQHQRPGVRLRPRERRQLHGRSARPLLGHPGQSPIPRPRSGAEAHPRRRADSRRGVDRLLLGRNGAFDRRQAHLRSGAKRCQPDLHRRE